MNAMAKYDVSTIKDLIDRLGGVSAVARWANMEHASGVSNWEARGVIPAGWHLRLLIRAKREGFTINPAIFDLSPEDLDFLLAAQIEPSESVSRAACSPIPVP